jgi:hypothetical protein
MKQHVMPFAKMLDGVSQFPLSQRFDLGDTTTQAGYELADTGYRSIQFFLSPFRVNDQHEFIIPLTIGAAGGTGRLGYFSYFCYHTLS